MPPNHVQNRKAHCNEYTPVRTQRHTIKQRNPTTVRANNSRKSPRPQSIQVITTRHLTRRVRFSLLAPRALKVLLELVHPDRVVHLPLVRVQATAGRDGRDISGGSEQTDGDHENHDQRDQGATCGRKKWGLIFWESELVMSISEKGQR